MKLTIAQLNPTMGDFTGNSQLIAAAHANARQAGSDLLLTPEMMLTGYPPEDLVLRPAFLRAAEKAVIELAALTLNGPAMVLGTPWVLEDTLINAALVLQNGRIQHIAAKQLLPNYGVFDEKRHFTRGEESLVVNIADQHIGVLVCEDIWQPEPARAAKAAGATVLVAINASPFEKTKEARRQAVVAARCQETGLSLVYINLVGGQDELVFDGKSFVMNAVGAITQQLPGWASVVEHLEL